MKEKIKNKEKSVNEKIEILEKSIEKHGDSNGSKQKKIDILKGVANGK